MTACRRRILCIVLVLTMLASFMPMGLSLFSAKADDPVVWGKTTTDSVNVRYGAHKSDKLLFQIPNAGYIGRILGEVYSDNIHWYQVEFQSPEKGNSHYYTGYINADFFVPLTEEETAVYNAGGSIATPTPIPEADPETGVTPTPTPVPVNNTETEAEAGTVGYITNGSGVNLRKGPSKSFGVITQLNRGDAVTVLSIPSVIDETTFYRVRYGDEEGFIMSTYLRVEGSDNPVPVITPTPTPEPEGVKGYVETTKGGVNLRQTPGGTKITTVGRYEVFPYLLEPVQKNGYTWYFVQAGNNRGYLRGDCVKVVTEPAPTLTPTAAPVTAEPGPGVVTPTPTPATGVITPTPAVPDPTGYVKTTTDKVNLRNKPAGSIEDRVAQKGTVLSYFGEPEMKNNVKWYKVYYGRQYLYIHGSYVTECGSDGSPVKPTPTPTPGPTPTGGGTSPDGGQTEASYSTLKLGSTGNAVKNLVTELINQGFYTGTAGTKYTSAVEAAVKKFQEAKGLKVDGIAGAATQHKLYGTVPVGTGDTTNLTMTLYPAEKIDWFTGGIQELWKRGDNYKVYDVYTGIVWWAHRWAGGNHADVETLTAADTARFCRMYGVEKASDITEKKHWQRRPSLVTIGTRTFACSLYGVPHNSDGDTIPNNNMTGQVCLHFTNSRVHKSNKVDSGHEEAIQYAWEHAPNGHK